LAFKYDKDSSNKVFNLLRKPLAKALSILDLKRVAYENWNPIFHGPLLSFIHGTSFGLPCRNQVEDYIEDVHIAVKSNLPIGSLGCTILSSSFKAWESISMDFISGLPTTQ
jgi:hypothetical protein